METILRRALPCGAFDYSDILTEEVAQLRRIQLLDKNLWLLLVDQFRDGTVDSERGTWKGEYWGKVMRGACFVYRASPQNAPDNELYAVLEWTVRDLLSTQDSLGRISTYSLEKEFTGWDIWDRKYVMLGLLYFSEICRDGELNEKITSALCAHADYIVEKIGRGEGQREIAACSNAWDGLNSCSILEPFVLLYNKTKEQKYLDFSEYIASYGGTLHENYFDKVLDSDILLSKFSQPKAYEMISCFEGLAELSKVTGDERQRAAVIRFGDKMLAEEATVVGSLGCDSESLNHASVMQSDRSFIPSFEFEGVVYHIMQETCVTVTWMKFLWQLWRMTGDVKYIDALEASAYNAMSGVLRDEDTLPENGGIPLPVHSYSPLVNSIRSPLMSGQLTLREGTKYSCCISISSAGLALDTLASAGTDADGKIYVNLYRNGRVTVGETVLDIKTDYPRTGEIKITVAKAKAGQPLDMRIPKWAVGATLDGKTVPCGYAETSVKTGDVLTLVLPLNVRLITPDEAADVPTGRDDSVCVMRGPVVYALDFVGDDEPAVDVDDISSATLTDTAAVPCRSALTLGGVTLVDYRSAAQRPGHKLTVWLKTK